MSETPKCRLCGADQQKGVGEVWHPQGMCPLSLAGMMRPEEWDKLHADEKKDLAILRKQVDILARAEITAECDALRKSRNAEDVLLAAYDRFKHIDSVIEMVKDSDGTEQTNPFYMTARDLWRAIKASLGKR